MATQGGRHSVARRRKARLGINALGDLEVDVMAVAWRLKKATVKDVFEVLYGKRRLAYTTIMTVMNRLAVKGILHQDRSQIPYVYKPLIDQNEMATSMVREVVDRVLEGSAASVVSYLLERGELDSTEISELKALIDQKSS